MTSNYQKFVEDALKKEARVSCYEIDGNKIYIKKREKQKGFRHLLQSMLQKITKEPMLIPTILENSENEVVFESNKLKILEKLGVNVPHVLENNQEYFIMLETGENLKGYIREQIRINNITDDIGQNKVRSKYILKALDTMITLHNTGNAQGGGQIRNFTIKDDVIYLIDFEEKIPEVYIRDFQKRDFLLFILSLQRARFNPNIKELFDYYSERTGYLTLQDELIVFLSKFKWILFLENRFFSKIRMKDVRDFMTILKLVLEMKKN